MIETFISFTAGAYTGFILGIIAVAWLDNFRIKRLKKLLDMIEE
jgi:hypothetical protein